MWNWTGVPVSFCQLEDTTLLGVRDEIVARAEKLHIGLRVHICDLFLDISPR